MVKDKLINQAVDSLKTGGTIVYPTESVYGLGCNPFDEEAVNGLLSLKQRHVSKGLILIASHIQQILPMIKPSNSNDLARALKTWPGHHTWIFPKTKLVPDWVSGEHNSVAVRVSNHPIVIKLCNKYNSPIISTSANISEQNTLKTIKEIRSVFGNRINYYLDAPTGTEKKPSTIHLAHSDAIIR
ncbi:MAG: L-threonylcarbamoyladenylate synthase [Marinicellaceae bacterium]